MTAAAEAYKADGWPQDYPAQHRPGGMDGYFYDILCVGGMPSEETLRRRIG